MRDNERHTAAPAHLGLALFLVLPLILFWMGCAREESDRFPVPNFDAPDLPGRELIVAEIGGEPITAAQLYSKMRIQFPEFDDSGPGMALQAREILPQLITERCFATWGTELGLDKDRPVQQAWFLSREFILCNYTMDQMVHRRAKPSEEEVHAYWEENQERFILPPRVWYHHILLDSEAEAWDIRQRILAGDEFERLAAEVSLDSVSAGRGGKMPAMTERYECGSLGRLPDLGRAVMALQEKELSKPIRSSHGWHVVRADYRRDSIVRELEEVRQEIVEKLAMRRQGQLYNKVLDSLRVEFGVRVHDQALDQFYLLQMDDEALFALAQQRRDSEYKIRVYEQILERYPDSPRRPEALFMIGFVFAEELADSTQALASFRSFLEQYPEHEMARSARLMLDELQ